MHKIPVYRPNISDLEKQYVNECLDSSWISSIGSFIPRFEKSFSAYTGIANAASVSNGTVALHLALIALGIGSGDEVIVPTLTYIASVNAISYTGATPVFADSDCNTWQIDPEDIQRKITSKTKAILVVHLYGNSCEMDEIVNTARKHGLFIIEDCAEAIGTFYKGKHVGTFGDIATFSFFGNKTITTGEGGMVMTNNDTLHDRVVHFKGQGLAKYRQYWHDVIGYNYRMTNICAAIGCAQLERVDEFLHEKSRIATRYSQQLESLDVKFPYAPDYVVDSHWMVSLTIGKVSQRDELRDHLQKAGVETRPVFYPIHTMPMYAKRFQSHPNAEFIAKRGITLPSYPDLKNDEIDFISQEIREFLTIGQQCT